MLTGVNTPYAKEPVLLCCFYITECELINGDERMTPVCRGLMIADV
jgi:hypothetical protein